MNKFTIIVVFWGLLILISSCTSVNHLNKYDLDKKGVYIEKLINMQLSTVRIHSNYNPPKINKGDSNNSKIIDPVDAYNIIYGVGNAVKAQMINDKLIDKINRAIQLDSVAAVVSDKMKFTLEKYYNTHQVFEFNDDCEFILTTYLEDCAIVINDNSTNLQIEIKCEIEHRKTGAIVWRKTESHNVALRSGAYVENSKISLNSILNLPILLTLSEDEISKSVYTATNFVANDMADEFRTDYRYMIEEKEEVKKKKK